MPGPLDADRLAALEEDAFRSWELFPHAHQILALEREVGVARQAVRQAVVRGFVAFEPLSRFRDIDRQRERHQQQTEADGGDRAGAARHADDSDVRNERSARRMPFRRVARDVS